MSMTFFMEKSRKLAPQFMAFVIADCGEPTASNPSNRRTNWSGVSRSRGPLLTGMPVCLLYSYINSA